MPLPEHEEELDDADLESSDEVGVIPWALLTTGPL